MPRFIHIPTADLAREATAAVTVEAEYGSFVMEGTVFTAAHHQGSGPFAGRHLPGFEETGRPSPCNDEDIPVLGHHDVVALSHIDLDSVGGALRTVADFAPLFDGRFAGFWALAEHIDVSGAHRLDPHHEWAPALRAVWAWMQVHRPRLSREEIEDCSEFMHAAGQMLVRLLEGDADLLAAGQAMADAEAELNGESMVRVAEAGDRLVVVREAPQFTNHLYRLLDGRVAAAVVAYNTVMKSVTVSLADPIEGVVCRDIVQALWGPDAGGHAGIAGSPRGQEMTAADLDACVESTVEAVRQPTLAGGA
jgi:hypothetical protein